MKHPKQHKENRKKYMKLLTVTLLFIKFADNFCIYYSLATVHNIQMQYTIRFTLFLELF